MGINQKTLETTPRLLVFIHLMDPTSALGLNSWNLGHERSHSRIIYINNAVQIEGLSKPVPIESGALVRARLSEFNWVKQWLGVA